MAGATAVQLGTLAVTAFGAYNASKTPSLPKVRDLGDPDDKKKKRNIQREMEQRKSSGRANTVLTGSNSLG